MRILLMPGSYPPILGGLQTVTHTLAQHLHQQGCQVRVVTNHYPRSLPAQEMLDSILVNRYLFLSPNFNDLRRGRVDLLLASLYFYPATLLRLTRLVQAFRPEVVNVHFPDSQTPFILRLRRRFNFRLVVSLHGHEILRWFEQGSTKNKKQKTKDRLKIVLRQADTVTACSRYLLDKAIAFESSVGGKGCSIPNGIDPERFAGDTAYAHPRPYLLSYGRLSYDKGFDMLLSAFAKVASIDPGIDLILAGEGEEQSNLYSQGQQLGLNGRLHLFGRATPAEIVALLNGCELVIVPSRRETFGLAALEAMAAGKPVLATRVGGLPEFVKGEANLLVEPTVTGLAKGLMELLKQGNSLKKMAAKNRIYTAKYSWDRVVERYLETYQVDLSQTL